MRENIIEGWGNNEAEIEVGDVHTKIQHCRRALSKWKRTHQSNSLKKIEALKIQVDQAQANDMISSEEVMNLKWDLCTAFREEELYWKQKTRANWLREGDRNTKFFHATTKQR